MKYCSNCGKELADGVQFCESCGTALTSNVMVEEAVVDEVVSPAPKKYKFVLTKKLGIIIGVVLVAAIIAGVVIGNIVSLNQYREKLEEAYDKMIYGAQRAEEYASLQSKVWRNCIYEDESAETDKYTKDRNGRFYDDFNDALSSFYKGEALSRIEIYNNVSDVDTYMSELKDCPDKFEDEYRALKELYVAYSGLTDLVVGDSSYSYNSFSEALESARSNYKSALSSAKLLIG